MWAASTDPVAGVSGAWWFLGTLVVSGSAVAVAWITVRRAKPSKRVQQRHLRSASDEAVREYRKLITESVVEPLRAELLRLQGRVTSAENRAEEYRRGWDDCVQDKLRGGRRD